MKKTHLAVIAACMTLAGCSQPAQPQAPATTTPAETPAATAAPAETTTAAEETSAAAEGMSEPGTDDAEADGFGGAIKVSVEVDAEKILSVTILSNSETDGIGSKAIESLPGAIVEKQSTEVEAVSGATLSSNGIKNAVQKALNTASGNEEANGALDEKPATLFDEGWSVKPEYGIVKGNYFKESQIFRQGHTGVLEVVTSDEGEILMVEFNETGRPNYYTRLYQDQGKRLSEYNFTMGERKGVAFIQGILSAEQQMIENQSLTDEIDCVAGASNSVQQSMIPMAAVIAEKLDGGSTQKYYSIAEDLGGGLSGKLDIVVENGKIIDCRYDEIFADSPEEIEDEVLKPHYRTSKYYSIYYEEPSRIGFNVQMDALNAKVVETQDLFDLTDLPAIEDTGDYKTGGFTLRNTAWDNYLSLAEKLHAEMVNDGVLK